MNDMIRNKALDPLRCNCYIRITIKPPLISLTNESYKITSLNCNPTNVGDNVSAMMYLSQDLKYWCFHSGISMLKKGGLVINST